MSASHVGKPCPKCAHVRIASETGPDWQCPKCGIAYAKFAGTTSAPPPEFSIHHEGEMDVIDYKVYGAEMQFVEIELDRGEAAIGEAGSLFYMEDGIQMETQLGDGSGRQLGVVDKLLSAGKRVLTGESLFITSFTNTRSEKRKVAFAAPYPGKIIPIDLGKIGGKFICQKDAFLCGAKGVSLGVHFQRRIGAGFFGGHGFIMQKLEGNGKVFVHAGGTMHQRKLKPFETLRVDTGCLVGMQDSVDFDIVYVGDIKTALFGGEGLFFATLRGPGTVLLQSLPFSRLASRLFALAPSQSASGSHSAQSVGGHTLGSGAAEGASLGAAGAAAGAAGAGPSDRGGTLAGSIEREESGGRAENEVESADAPAEGKGFLDSIGSLFSSGGGDSSSDETESSSDDNR